MDSYYTNECLLLVMLKLTKAWEQQKNVTSQNARIYWFIGDGESHQAWILIWSCLEIFMASSNCFNVSMVMGASLYTSHHHLLLLASISCPGTVLAYTIYTRYVIFILTSSRNLSISMLCSRTRQNINAIMEGARLKAEKRHEWELLKYIPAKRVVPATTINSMTTESNAMHLKLIESFLGLCLDSYLCLLL